MGHDIAPNTRLSLVVKESEQVFGQVNVESKAIRRIWFHFELTVRQLLIEFED